VEVIAADGKVGVTYEVLCAQQKKILEILGRQQSSIATLTTAVVSASNGKIQNLP